MKQIKYLPKIYKNHKRQKNKNKKQLNKELNPCKLTEQKNKKWIHKLDIGKL